MNRRHPSSNSSGIEISFEMFPPKTDGPAERLVRTVISLANLNPDFQIENGYPPNAAGKANMTYCSNSLAERFGALVMTLEMPFKDATDTPDNIQGWSPERCGQLARSCLDALHLCWDRVAV